MGGIQVQSRGNITKSVDEMEIQGRIRGAMRRTGKRSNSTVQRVTTRAMDWARSQQVGGGAVDYRKLNDKISRDLASENPRAGAEFDSKFAEPY